MSEKKKHHFIPACYLKGFTDFGKRNSKFWAFSKEIKAKKYKTQPNDACTSRDYYTLSYNAKPLLIEDWYGDKIEPKIGNFLKEIETTEKIPTGKNYEGLLWLLASLFLRTPSWRNSIEAPLLRSQVIAKSMANDLAKQGIPVINLDELSVTNDKLIEIEINQIKTVIRCLREYHFTLCIAPKRISVITSDAPFLLLNEKKHIYGLSTPGTYLLIPINKRCYLYGVTDKNNKGSTRVNAHAVASVNSLIINYCNRFFYSDVEEVHVLDESNKVIMY